MSVTSGSSNGGGGGGGGGEATRENQNKKNNLTGSLGAGTIGTIQVARDTPVAQAHKGSEDDGKAVIDIRPSNTSIVSGASSTPAQAHMGSENGGGNGAVDTTVTQKPTPNGEGPESTTITSGPRSDFSVVLAGQVGKRPDRSAARSNNFISLVGGAGGLGRKTSSAKRSLIGGA